MASKEIFIEIRGPQGSGKSRAAEVIASSLIKENWSVELDDAGRVRVWPASVPHGVAHIKVEQ